LSSPPTPQALANAIRVRIVSHYESSSSPPTPASPAADQGGRAALLATLRRLMGTTFFVTSPRLPLALRASVS
jgi:hypothetical protein